MVTVEPIDDLDLLRDYPVNPKNNRFVNSFWSGKGSSYLHLRSPVRRKELVSLLKGRSANAKSSLLSNSDERVLGWRITVKAPETVESLWALAPRAPSNEIFKAHCLAMDSCMKELHDWTSHVTSGKGVKTKGLIAACIHGDLSDQKVMGLQSDLILVNATPTSKKTAVSFEILGESSVVASKALSRVYEQDLHREIRQRLGLLSVQGATEREIFGVPSALSIEKSWNETRQEQMLESFRRGERAPYKNEWLRQANSVGWSLPEVKNLLQMGRKHQFNASPVRSDIRRQMREIHEKVSQETAQSSQQSKSKSTSHSHSH